MLHEGKDGSGTADDPWRLGTGALEDPNVIWKVVKKGSLAIDNTLPHWQTPTAVLDIRRTLRNTEIHTAPWTDVAKEPPRKKVRYAVVTVTLHDPMVGRTIHKFGGLDYAIRNKSFVDEAVQNTPPAKGKRVVKIGKFGRFTGYSVSDGPAGLHSMADYEAGKIGTDELLDNKSLNLPLFLSKVNDAMDKLSIPNHECDVAFADYPGSKDASGWMYPAIKSTVFLNRKISATAVGKYSAWKGPRSPHTLVHEYAHDVWFQAMSSKQRDTVTAYYDKHVKPDKDGAVKSLVSPTPYGATKVEEWWAEIVAYSIHPGRVAPEVLDFIVDVMKNKAQPVQEPTSKAAPAKTIIATPAPATVPDTPAGKLVKANDSDIKKVVGDYGIEARPDGSVRIIPADKQKAHNRNLLTTLAAMLGFDRHAKSPFRYRTSTGSQGGIVLFPEDVTLQQRRATLAEIADAEPLDYIDDSLLTLVTGKVTANDIVSMQVGQVVVIRERGKPDTYSNRFLYRRTEEGLALLDARGEPLTAAHKQQDTMQKVLDQVRRAEVKAMIESMSEGDYTKGAKQKWAGKITGTEMITSYSDVMDAKDQAIRMSNSGEPQVMFKKGGKFHIVSLPAAKQMKLKPDKVTHWINANAEGYSDTLMGKEAIERYTVATTA